MAIDTITQSYDYANIDKHRNILIIGEAANNAKLNQVVYCGNASISQVFNLYGISELSEAFELAKRLNIKDIFLANVRNNTDYVLVAEMIQQYEFSYVIPLGIKFSDSFYDPDKQRSVTYAEHFLAYSQGTSSTIIMTDEHATNYENMDHFLRDMFLKIKNFKNSSYGYLQFGENLCLVANNLSDYNMANLILGCVLCITDYDSYPDYDFGDAIFDIDENDIKNYELAYFRGNILTNTTIENLYNFRDTNDIRKIVLVDRIVKYVIKEKDFSKYYGRIFNDYIKMQIYGELGDFLRSIVGSIIESYKINSVTLQKSSDHSGIIILDYEITPIINSVDSYKITAVI